MPINVAIYLRISEDREGEELGVDRQREDCLAFVQKNGWNLYRVYSDNDTGASTRSHKPRPNYAQLLKDAAAGKVQTIVAYTSGRLTRRPAEHEEQIQLAERHGITYAYLRSPSFDLNTANGRMIGRIMAAKDANESEEIGERVSRARRQQAETGKFGGGIRPYGFEKDGLTRIEAECKVIRDAGIAYLSGVSLRSLAKDLNTQGVPAPRSDQWKAETLSEIFKRPRNIARMESKAAREKAASNAEATWLDKLGVVAVAPWDPIFSDDTYQAILAKLSRNCCRTSEGTVGRAVKYLLSGIARCWLCGDTMEVHRNGNRHPVYRCRTMVPRTERMQAPACDDHYCGHWSCIQVRGCGTAPMEPLDAYVRELVIDRLSRPDALDLFAAPTAEVDTAALRLEVATLRQRKSDLAEAFGLGGIDVAHLSRESKNLQARIEAAEAAILGALDVSPLAPLLGVDDVTTAYDDLALGTRRAVIEALYSITVMSPAVARPRGPKAAGKPTMFDPSSVRVGLPVSVG